MIFILSTRPIHSRQVILLNYNVRVVAWYTDRLHLSFVFIDCLVPSGWLQCVTC